MEQQQDKRFVILDTETTGMDPATGDRIVEIGCVECINHVATGKTLHLYLNPERDVPAGAVAVHGLTYEFLKNHPTFAEVVDKFVDFVGDDICVAHNADFDMKFLNAELKTLGFPAIPPRRVVDTVAMARRKFPGSPASLDALCRRQRVANAKAQPHRLRSNDSHGTSSFCFALQSWWRKNFRPLRRATSRRGTARRRSADPLGPPRRRR